MSNGFFAMASRMKYINRWSLMRNEHRENLCEHSFETASVAHALAVIGNRRFGRSYNAERAALIGLYHDTPETLTGDMPTPVKYYSEQVRDAYKTVEENACKSLLSMLPEDFRQDYSPLFVPCEQDSELWRLVKAADKISALIKCLQEKRAGNSEFVVAAKGIYASLEKMNLPEAEFFINEFLPPYDLTLDELRELK